jgi:hypothetical protein
VKRLAFLFLVALASAALTYFVVGLRRPPDHLAQIRGTDLQWLQVEFDLTDEQLAAVRELHDEYSGRCAQHCADIMAARAHLATLPAGPSADRIAGERRVVELEAICNDATRVHLRRVAGCMPPVQGERFLRTVEPHLAQLPHDGARGLGR